MKNSASVSTPRSTASLATFSAGSMPNTGNAALGEVLQEVAVVARKFHDQRLLVETRAGW